MQNNTIRHAATAAAALLVMALLVLGWRGWLSQGTDMLLTLGGSGLSWCL